MKHSSKVSRDITKESFIRAHVASSQTKVVLMIPKCQSTAAISAVVI